MIPTDIDWALVGRAVEYYKNRGFKYVEVPWMVTAEAIRATLPKNKRPFYIDGTSYDLDAIGLVGSAEQSFVQLMLDGALPPGKYVAASPCFRDDETDDLHAKTFFKVELIEIGRNVSLSTMREDLRLLHIAWDFFKYNGGVGTGLMSVETKIGFDLELNGIEIGSYGYRKFKGHSWIYGTGLAEPRFSLALKGGVK